MVLIECVPNVSEGRRQAVVDLAADRLRKVSGLHLLDYSADPAHNRSVFTMVGGATSVEEGVLALTAVAIDAIDLRNHRGEHPRIGAVDVVPFIPLGTTSMAACIALAEQVGRLIAERFGIPVFLYEEAARHPWRRRLEDIRRGQFEGLPQKLALPMWQPDFGPARPHPTAGAIAVGARKPLIAYNVNLATDRLDVARRIAASVRESSGGLPAVKALGLALEDRGITQVSMNLTDYERTPIARVFDRVAEAAAREGVAILEGELIGLIPAAALAGTTPAHLRLHHFTANQILERRLAEARED